jgi:hypothetical protein
MRIEVAEVDHGSDTATATARQPASCRKLCRSGSFALRLVFIVGSGIGYTARPRRRAATVGVEMSKAGRRVVKCEPAINLRP